ncbi:hypothetical protein F4780DRAFT_245897 [Xylariomycetidae sp. FL0641]|nr:hypothetical protein F4780DRAFT_245897 [Xylariomycetidae sp. FL0641]
MATITTRPLARALLRQQHLARPFTTGGTSTSSSSRTRLFAGAGGLTLGAGVALRQAKPLRMDALGAPRYGGKAKDDVRQQHLEAGLMSEGTLRQVSGGSVAGFVAGLLVSMFSRTLVLLFGLSVVAVQVAARYGIDLMKHAKLKERLGNTKVLAALEKNPAWKLSFGVFFAMSAFMQF